MAQNLLQELLFVMVQLETGRTEIWYLVNPTATTANLVVTTWDASTDRRIAGVYSFYNAKQTSPIGATAYDDEITTVTDGAITPTEEGSMIVDCIGSGSNGAPNDSLTAGWSVLIGGDDRIGASQYKVNPTIGSANTMAWTFASDKGVNWIAVEVKSANPTGSSAQLVSSLTNKSSLKAHYTMDSTSKSLPTATLSEDFSSSSAWTLHSSSSISGGSLTCNNTGESYRSTGLGKPTNLTWEFTWTRNSGDAGDTSSLIHFSEYRLQGSFYGHTNVQIYMANWKCNNSFQ